MISKLSAELIKLSGEYNRCTINKCLMKKIEFMKNKDVSSYTSNSIGVLKNLSKKEQEKQLNKWIDNKKSINLSRCRFEKCNDITRKFMKTNMDLVIEMKKKNNKNLSPEIKSYLDEYNRFLKLQKLTDDDIKELKRLSYRIKL